MDKPKFSKYSIFTLVFFAAGILYYTMQKNDLQSKAIIHQLGQISQKLYYKALVDKKLVHLHGETMGGIQWNIKYIDPKKASYQKEMDSLLVDFNLLFSTYDSTSTISQFNRSNVITAVHPWFYEVLTTSSKINAASDGAFDPTVMPLVNAWGFGPKKFSENPSQATIDSLLQFVGYQKIVYDSIKVTKPTGVTIDFSAIAKGYAVDKLAEFLETKGYKNYMVEIGGEVRCKGRNIINNKWGIQIVNPQKPRSGVDLIGLDQGALATSGNYINYRMVEGKKYAHSIDPKTGSAKESNLLSASIHAPTCIDADAYATACMVMGFNKARGLIENSDELEGYLIYFDGKMAQVWRSAGMKKLIIE